MQGQISPAVGVGGGSAAEMHVLQHGIGSVLTNFASIVLTSCAICSVFRR